MTRILQIGNQGAPHATEAAYRDGYRDAGALVVGVEQAEAHARGGQWVLDMTAELAPHLVAYSRTHNNTALGPEWTDTWRELEQRGIKTASVHLDVFWGIPEREGWIAAGDALFTTGTVFTADGDASNPWAEHGVNHQWLPPGADVRFVPAAPEPLADLAGKIVFVGSRGYHSEWPHRESMLAFCRSCWPDRFVEYGNGSPNGTVRGEDLARIYASDCLVVGDSMFAGVRSCYWSDRIPETLARGGLLLQTMTPGLDAMYDPGVEFLPWEAGNFEQLLEVVAFAQDCSPERRLEISNAGKVKVLTRDTYRHRARQVLETLDLLGVE